MSNNGAKIYWIDPTTSKLEFCIVMEYELRNGYTYETEALCKKIPSNIVYTETILFSEDGMDSAIERLEALKRKTTQT